LTAKSSDAGFGRQSFVARPATAALGAALPRTLDAAVAAASASCREAKVAKEAAIN
jgi:hypothetical protein